MMSRWGVQRQFRTPRERGARRRWLSWSLGAAGLVLVLAALGRAEEVKRLPATSSDAPCITGTVHTLPTGLPGCTPAETAQIPVTVGGVDEGSGCPDGECSVAEDCAKCPEDCPCQLVDPSQPFDPINNPQEICDTGPPCGGGSCAGRCVPP